MDDIKGLGPESKTLLYFISPFSRKLANCQKGPILKGLPMIHEKNPTIKITLIEQLPPTSPWPAVT
ncbi:hypothetical protein K0M31_017745 [Melipona bicolor]|uniref:Uncharacterized protein n=1 Tax=Melipona bicolor TaxID=60889 RepID=A0AA40G5G0_9HYME|nr:hypothetical protein K0M31_017745 [Melipona bicolor]